MASKILFNVLKYILIVVNVLFIIGCLLLTICGTELMEVQYEKYHSSKSLNQKILIFVALISIALFSVGIVGAVKAHLPLTLTYAILMTISLVLEAIKLPARGASGIGSFLILAFVVGCAYLYAVLIDRIKKTQAVTQEHQLNKI